LKFIVDAQLPRKLAQWLIIAGSDAVHTWDLPNRNRTTDRQIIDIADSENWVVVTKDSDFVDSHLLNGKPAKLFLISTGNISNSKLEALLVPLIPILINEFMTSNFLELDQTGLVIRG
jgi:predicted nuclease of predicted toxin-antitoxin system